MWAYRVSQVAGTARVEPSPVVGDHSVNWKTCKKGISAGAQKTEPQNKRCCRGGGTDHAGSRDGSVFSNADGFEGWTVYASCVYTHVYCVLERQPAWRVASRGPGAPFWGPIRSLL